VRACVCVCVCVCVCALPSVHVLHAKLATFPAACNVAQSKMTTAAQIVIIVISP
jgi:hypothetical protein